MRGTPTQPQMEYVPPERRKQQCYHEGQPVYAVPHGGEKWKVHCVSCGHTYHDFIESYTEEDAKHFALRLNREVFGVHT